MVSSLQIMFILPPMRDQLSYKTAFRGGLFRDVSPYKFVVVACLLMILESIGFFSRLYSYDILLANAFLNMPSLVEGCGIDYCYAYWSDTGFIQ